MSTKKEYKVIVMGDSNVGKTSIIQRYATQTFDPEKEATIGASFLKKSVDTDRGIAIINIWDTAGQERFKSLISTYSRGANAVIFVFDLSSMDSFNNLDMWREELKKSARIESVLLFLVGNKSDLEVCVPDDKAQEWADQNNAVYTKTSSLNGNGIDELFTEIGSLLLEKQPYIKREQIADAKQLEEPKQESSCC